MRVFDGVDEAAAAAARYVAARARDAVGDRGRFTIAFSGGRTPGRMFEALVDEAVPWASVHVLQVDERAAPDGDADRNWTGLDAALLSRVAVRAEHCHPMPVGDEDLGVSSYAKALALVCGSPPVIDLVHLGMGPDGHTASLVPGDPILEVSDAEVAACGTYQGRRRLSLTYPALNRARERLWLVTGADKAEMLSRMGSGDTGVPAGRITGVDSIVFADRDAAPLVG